MGVLRWSLSQWRVKKPLDIVLALVLTLALSRLVDIATTDPGTLYQVAGGAAVGLVAFVVTPVATLLTLMGGLRSQKFDARHRPTIVSAMSWGFLLSLALLVASVLASAIDSHNSPVAWVRWGTVTLVLAAALAVSRLFWFFLAALAVRQADRVNPLS